MICGLESIYRLISSRNGKWKQIVSNILHTPKVMMALLRQYREKVPLLQLKTERLFRKSS